MYDEDEGSAGYDEEADVFAFGMTIYEMLTMGGWPYGKVDWMQIEKLVTKGRPPTVGGPKIPTDTPAGFLKCHTQSIELKPVRRVASNTRVIQ